jgi:DivIVA domain-containing protein
MNQVDEFLEKARDQYNNPAKELVSVFDVRAARFGLVKNGYSISVVDAALEKLEDTFAEREYQREVKKTGYFEFTEDLKELKEMVLRRTNKKRGRKFSRRIWPNRGYSVREVDKFCSYLGKIQDTKADLSVKEIRIATFKSKRGGYAEYQVDAFLEKVVEVLQREAAIKAPNR